MSFNQTSGNLTPINGPIIAGDDFQKIVDKTQGQISTLMTNAGNPLQAETITYINRVKAKPNTYISSFIVQEIDSFFVQGKAGGWLAKMAWMYCPLGTTLAGALVNLYNVDGVPNEVVNNNFVEADYTQDQGIGTDSEPNNNKWLGTGIILNSLPTAITNRSLSIGMFIPSDTAMENKPLLSINPTTGDPQLTIMGGVLASLLSNANQSFDIVAPGLIQASFSGQFEYNHAKNGIVTMFKTDVNTTSTPFDSEVTLFKGTFTSGATTLFSRGKIGMAYLGLPLTYSQTEHMGKAIRRLMEVSNRVNNIGGRIVICGDSIMAGAGASESKNRGATLLARSMSLNEYNVAQGFSALRQTDGTYGVLGFTNYYNNVYKNINWNTILIGYGTNDMHNYDGSTNGDATAIADYKTKYINALATLKNKRGRIIVTSVMWTSPTNYTKRNAYVLAAYQSAISAGAFFLNANDLFSDMANPASFFTDGVHPNDLGHRTWSAAVLALVQGRVYRNLSLTFPTVVSNNFQELTINILGVKVGMSTTITPTSLITGITYQAIVTADDTITIRATNNTAANITIVAAFYRVEVSLIAS